METAWRLGGHSLSTKIITTCAFAWFLEKLFGELFVSILRTAVFWLCAFTPFAVNAQSAPMIPGGVAGTYELSYSGTMNASIPYKVGDKVSFVLNSADASICINGTKVNYGAMLTSSNVRYIHAGFDYVLVIAGNNLSEITLYKGSRSLLSNPETLYGRFTGTRTSTATVCGGTPSLVLAAPEQALLDVAGDLFPAFFAQASELQAVEGYRYKFFATSGMYIAFKDDRIYALGGPFGNALVDLGLVSGLLTQLQTEKANTFKNISPGIHWTFNGQVRDDPKAGISITATGFQTGSGQGLSVTLTAGNVFFPPGLRWSLEIVSPTASPVVIPKGKYFCSLTSGAYARALVADTNFLGYGGGSDCYLELAEDLAVGKPAIGAFRMTASNNAGGSTAVVTGTFNLQP